MKKVAVFFALLLFSGFSVYAEEKKTSIRFSGIPALNYDSDSGFGAGAIGSMYFDKEGFAPYKTAIGAKIFFTTKGNNSHNISFDSLKVFGLPLRITSRLGFYSTFTQGYCGKASEAKCDLEKAKTLADNKNLTGRAKDDFVRDYYRHRFMLFYGELNSRWLLWEDIAKLELMLGYRGHYYLNRDFSQKGVYPGSLFDTDFKNEKTEGYLSTLELGLMLDKRDNEPAPTSGYWLEASVRGASHLIGSTWNYLGANLSARFYWPLDEGHKIVIASQTIIDAILGDLPFDAMSRIGGSQALNDLNAIGGKYIGRGISEQLYVGRFKAIEQLEIRYKFWSFDLWKQNFDLTGAFFTDIGMTSWDYQRFLKDMKKVYVGFGSGLRISWNKTFIVRADLGISPEENFLPKFYLTVGNVF
jgi:outer membrane protein assembly factor BamA